MTPTLSGALPAAIELWRRHAAVLHPIAGSFFLLPVLAQLLLLPVPDFGGLADEALARAVSAWLVASLPWLFASLVVQAFGGAVVLTLLLDRRDLTVAAAVGAALRRLPAYLLAWTVALLGVAAGLLAFVVPGLYFLGRSYLVGATVIAEPEQHAGQALARALALTRGHGWMLTLLVMGVSGGEYLVSGLMRELMAVFAGSAIAGIAFAVLSVVVSATAAAASLLLSLLQVVLYRRLAEAPRQGI